MDRLPKIIELLDESWQLEQQFLNEQPVEERDRPGTFEHWSRKDVVGHIETWNGRLAENILLSLRGDEPIRRQDFNAENKKIFDMLQSLNWQQVYNLASQAHQNLAEAARQLGNDGLERTDILPWQDQPIWRNIGGNAYNHALIHVAEHYRELGDKARYARLIEQMALSTSGLDDSDAWQGTMVYNLACAHALTGQKEKALEELCDALRLNPGLREWSQQDSDLEPLRGEPAYQALYESL